MIRQITISIPQEVLEIFDKSGSECARDVFETAVVKWYDDGKISSGKGAEFLGISRREFLDLLFRHNVSPFQYTPEELAAELSRG